MIAINNLNINKGEDLIELLNDHSLGNHTFFQKEGSNNIGYISLILENGRELDITKFLARLISMSNNFEIRAKLVPQLYDELGAGNSSKIHVYLIVKLLKVIKPYALISEDDSLVLNNAYEGLNQKYHKLFNTNNVAEGIGVAIANEIIVQPIFEYFLKIMRPSFHLFNKADLEWLLAHDELEEDHVKDSIDLTKLLDSSELVAATNSAISLHNAIWEFFNELEKVKIQNN